MITIFSIPKAFAGHSHIIQTNAIKSWTRLDPQPQIILFGDEPGTGQMARDMGLQHIPQIECNQFGTPLLHDVFAQAHRLACRPILAYVNADIILLNDFLLAIEQIRLAFLERFLMLGRRIDLAVTEPINFAAPAWGSELRHRAAHEGVLAARVCKDYFVFPQPLFAEIPPFAVGRGHWDNWMVYAARQQGLPVIEATKVVTAIHQNHDYSHVPGGRGQAYVTSQEAKQNAELAGGMRLVEGAAVTWQLNSSGLRPKHLPPLALFLADLPRFCKLLIELFSPI
jgi:hypothetical protein